jgi:hypothetical protein
VVVKGQVESAKVPAFPYSQGSCCYWVVVVVVVGMVGRAEAMVLGVEARVVTVTSMMNIQMIK